MEFHKYGSEATLISPIRTPPSKMRIQTLKIDCGANICDADREKVLQDGTCEECKLYYRASSDKLECIQDE